MCWILGTAMVRSLEVVIHIYFLFMSKLYRYAFKTTGTTCNSLYVSLTFFIKGLISIKNWSYNHLTVMQQNICQCGTNLLINTGHVWFWKMHSWGNHSYCQTAQKYDLIWGRRKIHQGIHQMYIYTTSFICLCWSRQVLHGPRLEWCLMQFWQKAICLQPSPPKVERPKWPAGFFIWATQIKKSWARTFTSKCITGLTFSYNTHTKRKRQKHSLIHDCHNFVALLLVRQLIIVLRNRNYFTSPLLGVKRHPSQFGRNCPKIYYFISFQTGI